MKISRVLLLMTSLLILSANVWATGEQEAAAPVMEPAIEKTGVNDTFNFFNNEEWKYLKDPNSVYQTMTYDQMTKLFESEGTYMVLFGGSWCINTQSVVSQINDVAKEYGVETIYNYDWRVDGKSGEKHLRDNDNEFRHLYVDMVNKYLPNIVTISDRETGGIRYTNEAGEEALANKMYVPFLMVYNKDNKDSNGNAAPIVVSYEEMFKWSEDFQTDGKDDEKKIEAYKKGIRPMFDYISKDGVAQLDYVSTFDYFASAFNGNEGATIFDSSDEKSFVFETVSYSQLQRTLDSEGTYVFTFGGPWCSNTRAVVKLVNEYANKYNIDTVYNYDTKFDSSKFNIRDQESPFKDMYVDLVKTYFPGIITRTPLEENDIRYTNEAGSELVANRLWVPYVFVYNKDNVDASGNPDPILGQIELMYKWNNIQPDFVNEDGVTGANYKSYTEALDTLFSMVK
jgi:thiol-disulfide isomerase/thioredoxin